MSKISTVYDGLVAQLATLYPNKTRLPRPLSLEENDSNWLDDGYGLAMVGAVQSNFQEFICNGRYRRTYTFEVVLTRCVADLESETGEYDIQSKNLMEDLKLAYDVFHSTNNLNIDEIEKIDLGNASRIEDVFTESDSYITINLTINITISEDI